MVSGMSSSNQGSGQGFWSASMWLRILEYIYVKFAGKELVAHHSGA